MAIENGHRNSGFSHKKMVIFQFAMLVYQRVTCFFSIALDDYSSFQEIQQHMAAALGRRGLALHVPIEHHPTMNGIWSTRWLLFQVMSNIPKMGQLPTPDTASRSRS